MRRARIVGGLIGLLLLAGAAALAYRLGAGARYRLYTSPAAGDCWRAVELTALSTSTLTPVSVGAPTRAADGRTAVSIDYVLDRVLGGATLTVRCTRAADGSRLESVDFDGIALDAAGLARVNRELARD